METALLFDECVLHLFVLRLCLREFGKQSTENLPCVLIKCDKDGKPHNSAPGLQVLLF